MRQNKLLAEREFSGEKLERLITKIAKSFVLPGEQGVNPYRFSSPLSTSETALSTLKQELDVAASPNEYVQEANTFMMAKFKHMVRNLVYHAYSSAGFTFQYDAQFANGLSYQKMPVDQGMQFVKPVVIKYTSGDNIHGMYLGIGKVKTRENESFIWLDVGVVVTMTFNNVSTTTQQVQLARMVGGTYTVVSFTGPFDESNNYTLTVSVPAYYSFGVVSSSTSVGTLLQVTFSMVGTTIHDIMAHRTTKDLDKNVAIYEGFRVLNGSALARNETNDFDKAGNIAGYKAPVSSTWMDYTSMADFRELNGAETRLAKTGMYGWHPISSPSELDMLEDIQYDSGVLTRFTFPLFGDAGFIMFMVAVPANSDFIGVLRTVDIVEFTTSSQIVEVRTSNIPSEIYNRAIERLKNAPNLTENPWHIKDLVQGVQKVGKALYRGAEKGVNFYNRNKDLIQGGSKLLGMF